MQEHQVRFVSVLYLCYLHRSKVVYSVGFALFCAPDWQFVLIVCVQPTTRVNGTAKYLRNTYAILHACGADACNSKNPHTVASHSRSKEKPPELAVNMALEDEILMQTQLVVDEQFARLAADTPTAPVVTDDVDCHMHARHAQAHGQVRVVPKSWAPAAEQRTANGANGSDVSIRKKRSLPEAEGIERPKGTDKGTVVKRQRHAQTLQVKNRAASQPKGGAARDAATTKGLDDLALQTPEKHSGDGLATKGGEASASVVEAPAAAAAVPVAAGAAAPAPAPAATATATATTAPAPADPTAAGEASAAPPPVSDAPASAAAAAKASSLSRLMMKHHRLILKKSLQVTRRLQQPVIDPKQREEDLILADELQAQLRDFEEDLQSLE